MIFPRLRDLTFKLDENLEVNFHLVEELNFIPVWIAITDGSLTQKPELMTVSEV